MGERERETEKLGKNCAIFSEICLRSVALLLFCEHVRRL